MKKREWMTTIALFTVAVLTAATTAGEEAPGRWNFSVGPAWRARVKSSISGRGSGPSLPASHAIIYDQDFADHGPWNASEVRVVENPDYPNSDQYLYAATRIGSEVTVTPLSGSAALHDSDIDRPLGISLSGGYDFFQSGSFSAGLALRFAGYWNMKSQACGHSSGALLTARSWRDFHLFSGGPIPPDEDFDYCEPDADPHLDSREDLGTMSQTIPGQRMCARLSSDLYQIGIGPRLTWQVCDQIDLFGSVEALCNLAYLEAEYDDIRRSETDCRPGVGARLGLVAYLTDNVGLHVDAGYEWVDEANISLGKVRAKADYSSVVVTAGIALRF
jgi:hypothetical protein